MKRYRFDESAGKPIRHFGSENASVTPLMRILKTEVGIVQIGCMHVGEYGLIGGHEATVPQMFAVVSGEGWVAGEDRVRHPIQAGQLAVWEEGEWHETSTEHGLSAIVIETEALVPFPSLKEIHS